MNIALLSFAFKMCVKNLLLFIDPLLFDDGEQRFSFHSLLLFQLEELLSQHILVSLSQPGTEKLSVLQQYLCSLGYFFP